MFYADRTLFLFAVNATHSEFPANERVKFRRINKPEKRAARQVVKERLSGTYTTDSIYSASKINGWIQNQASPLGYLNVDASF